MCDWDGKVDPFRQKGQYRQANQDAICCQPGDTSNYCKPNILNKCSPKYKDAKEKWFLYCPKLNEKTCGGYQNFEVLPEEQKFGFHKLKYLDKAFWKT